jgi:membrane protein implicated in regulation of membrane protease activity
MPYLDKMKTEDIIFWLIIGLIVGVAIWKLFGSPTDTATLISIALFVAGSEIILWKALFKIDKKTTVGFERVKNQLGNIQKDIKEIKLLIKN